MPKYSCTAEVADAGRCRKEDNMGWRYLMFTLGGLTMAMVRHFLRAYTRQVSIVLTAEWGVG